jgi:molecular chaperone HscB
MIDFSQDYFALFGLPRSYSVDEGALDVAYRKLQSVVHPDRFASAAEPERRRALQASARVNEAYRVLKDPVERAQYLLSLNGIDALSETDTSLPLDFLEGQLERREAIAEAAEQRDSGALDALQRDIRAQARELEASLASELDSRSTMSDARTTVRKLKLLSKLVADIVSTYAQIED